MRRVIIADDEPKVALLIRKLIQWDELGLELVATAADGISALAMIEDLEPEIVITDIRMPGYDGIELIARAKRLNPEIDFIIISGYRHFDYAQKAIRFGVEDYLLKPLKAVEINQTLRKMVEKYEQRDLARQREVNYSARIESDVRLLREQFIAGLLAAQKRAGQVAPNAGPAPLSLGEVNRDFNLGFRADLFQAFVVKADVHFDSLNDNVRKLLLEKTLGAIKAALLNRCHASVLHPTERGICGIVNFAEEHRKPLRRALAAMIDELQSQGELFDRIRVTVGVGSASDEINTLPASLREAQCALANRLIYGPGRVIDRAGTLDADDIVRQVFTATARNGLLKGIEILDAAQIRTAIAGIATAVGAHEAMTGTAIVELCAECIQVLHFGLKSQNSVDGWVEDREAELSEKLEMCNCLPDVFHLLDAYACELVAHVVALRKNENSKPVREAQKYINAHFRNPVSLEVVAQRAGFNPTYFSVLFKKETGMNFLEYLSDVRIKEAKRVLSDPAKTIADVADEVGYSDVKHFSKLFTRITGIHPSKYRKLYY